MLLSIFSRLEELHGKVNNVLLSLTDSTVSDCIVKKITIFEEKNLSVNRFGRSIRGRVGLSLNQTKSHYFSVVLNFRSNFFFSSYEFLLKYCFFCMKCLNSCIIDQTVISPKNINFTLFVEEIFNFLHVTYYW